MSHFLFDLRIAWRSLLRRPGLLVVGVVTLGLGIGVAATVFAAVDTLLLRSVPGVREPERVVEIGRSFQGRGFDSLSYPDVVDLSEQRDVFEAVAGWDLEPMSLSTGGAGERILGFLVSPSYFGILGVEPGQGRFFLPEEGDPADPRPVVVVSHDFWQRRLGGESDVVGRTVEIDRQTLTVVGVAPPDFSGHVVGFEPEVWMPLSMTTAARPGRTEWSHRNSNWLMVVARLAPGVTEEQADARVAALFEGLRQEHPDLYRQKQARVLPLGPVPGAGRGAVGMFLTVVMGLVGLLVLVVCVNLGGLLLARGTSRRREMAVRLAVGSGRSRLVRQLLLETLVLFLLGGAAGSLVAVWGAELLSSFRLPFPDAPRLELTPDLRVMGFALGAALVSGLIFGLIPALRASRPDLVPALKNDAEGGGRGGALRRSFVAAQVALSLLLAVSAGLFLRSLGEAGAIDPGFEPGAVVTASFDLALDGYDEPEGQRFLAELSDRLEQLPGMDSAAVARDLPMDLSSHGNSVYPEGWEAMDDDRGFGTDLNIVTPGYFETLSILPLRGRVFGPEDRPGAPGTVVVSSTFAEQVWPGKNPLGRSLRFEVPDAEPLTVVGVVADVKNQLLSETTSPMIYLPLTQHYRPQLQLVARPRPEAAAGFGSRVRGEVLAVDPRLALGPVMPLAELTAVGLLPQRLAAALTTGLGFLALLLSGIGVYGVAAYATALRRREVGIRMALGADRQGVLSAVLRRELWLALPGFVVGALLALVASRLLESLLLGVSPLDPAALLGAGGLLLVVVLAAGFLPARKASRLEPMAALKTE